MKKAFLLGCAVALQAAVLPYVDVYGVSFNIVLALLVLYGFAEGSWRRFLAHVCAAGLVLDALSGAPFGVFLAGLLAAIGFSAAGTLFLPHENAFHFAALVAFSSAWFFLAVFGYGQFVVSLGASVTFAGALASVAYNTAGALALYPFRKWITS